VCFRAICYVYFVIIWYIFRFGMFHQEKSCSPTDNICKQRLLMFNNTYMYTFVVKCVLQNTEINPAKIMKAKIYVVSVLLMFFSTFVRSFQLQCLLRFFKVRTLIICRGASGRIFVGSGFILQIRVFAALKTLLNNPDLSHS
jgi:hypothetical protein